MSHVAGVPQPPRRARRVTPVVAVATGLVAASMAVASHPADATTQLQDARPPVRLVVADLQAVVGPPDPPSVPEESPAATPQPDVTMRLLVENLSDEPLTDARLVVELESPVLDRTRLRDRLVGGPVGFVGTEVLQQDAIDTVPAGGVGQLAVTIDGDDADLAPPAGSRQPVSIRPLSVSLLLGSTVLDEVRTAVVGVSGADVPPLEAAVVMPIDHEPGAPPPPGPTGDAGEGAADAGARSPLDPALAAGGRVDRLTAAVEAAPAGALGLAPAAHTLEDLVAAGPTGGAGELLARIRALAEEGDAHVVSTPYALASVPALVADPDTAPLASTAVGEGRQRLGRALGTAPGSSHLGVAPQTPASLDLVPGDLLVTRWTDVRGLGLARSSSATRTAVTPAGRILRVLVADPWVEQILAEASVDNGPAVVAHRVVIETAAAWAEDPQTAGRTFGIVPPTAWEAPGALPRQLTTRLSAAPWLRLSSPAAVVQRSSDETGWATNDAPAGELVEVLPELARVAERFGALASAVPDGEEPVVFGRRDELLRSVTAWPTPSPRERALSVLADLDAGLDDVEGSVSVPNDTTVTLASERGVVPVTVRRDGGPPLDVVVQVRPRGSLAVDGDEQQLVTLTEDGATTVGFDTRALGTGTIPLVVDVRTPDGRLVLASEVIRVRATAVSTPALLGIAAAVLLLLVLGRRRRSSGEDTPRLEVVR